MAREALRAELRALMASVFELTPESLPAPADTDNVGKWDSLGHLMLIENIEVAFAVAFDHAETLDMLSEDAVLEHLAARIPAPVLASGGAN